MIPLNQIDDLFRVLFGVRVVNYNFESVKFQNGFFKSVDDFHILSVTQIGEFVSQFFIHLQFVIENPYLFYC
jgi:hypothetical protein